MSIQRPFDLAPSAELGYVVKARQSGFTIDGTNTMKWQAGEGKYSVKTETRANLLGRVSQASSDGNIDAFGLAPLAFMEKRIRRDAAQANFDRSNNTITFNSNKTSYPIQGGEQDRNSVLWQLIANARANPKKFTNGSEWQYFVAGGYDADPWTFKVMRFERIETPYGTYNALRVNRLPLSNNGQHLDIWLAPSLDWYPIRLKQTEQDGDYFEQSLERLNKK